MEKIVCCDKRLEEFCRVDAYWPYDHLGRLDTITHPHTFTKDQLRLTNTVMRARSPYKSWRPMFDYPLPQLAAIPTMVDLIEAPDQDYSLAEGAVGEFYAAATQHVYITDMAASKMAYLHRPELIAISDSYVRKSLEVPDTHPAWGQGRSKYAGRGLAVLDAVRACGRSNRTTLAQLKGGITKVIYEGEPGRIGGVCVAGKVMPGTPVSMSLLRILDVFLWTQAAIKGEHPVWAKWWSDHRRQCAGSAEIKLER